MLPYAPRASSDVSTGSSRTSRVSAFFFLVRRRVLTRFTGGLTDGTVVVYRLDSSSTALTQVFSGKAPDDAEACGVSALEFRRVAGDVVLALGHDDGRVAVLDVATGSFGYPSGHNVNRVTGKPTTTAQVTSVAWNAQVPHILASSASDASTTVYDVNAGKVWCVLRDPHASPVSKVLWNPTVGLSLITCSTDGNLYMWDLGRSKQMPAFHFTDSSHSEGILDASWNTCDPRFVATSGQDDLVKIWDVSTGQCVDSYGSGRDPRPPSSPRSSTTTTNDPSTALRQQPSRDAAAVFASASGPSSNGARGGSTLHDSISPVRYQCDWCPHPSKAHLLLTCDVRQSVEIRSFHDLSNAATHPNWMTKRCGPSFGFGGRLLRPPSSTRETSISLEDVRTNPKLRRRSQAFYSSFFVPLQRVSEESNTPSYDEFGNLVSPTPEMARSAEKRALKKWCLNRSSESRNSANESRLWRFMSVLFEEENEERTAIAHLLGFDALQISSEIDAERVLKDAESVAREPESQHEEDWEVGVRRALLVSDFEGAVARCLARDKWDDALVFASAGGPELWSEDAARVPCSERL